MKKIIVILILQAIVNSGKAQNNCQPFLCNSDFELPHLTGNVNIQRSQDDPDAVPCWKTTAADHKIEIWANNFGPPAYTGTQYAELNCDDIGALYQDFTAAAGSCLTVTFAHMGRNGNGVGPALPFDNKMIVSITEPDGSIFNEPMYQATINVWTAHSFTYTCTLTGIHRLQFSSWPSGGTYNEVGGNFLDAITVNYTTPSVTLTQKDATCDMHDGTITVTAIGCAPPFNYSWQPAEPNSPNISGLAPGTYTVTVTDGNGCTASISTVIHSKDCSCCKKFDKHVIGFMTPPPSTNTFNISFSAGPNKIKKIIAEIVDFSVSYNDHSSSGPNGGSICAPCVPNSDQWGNFVVANPSAISVFGLPGIPSVPSWSTSLYSHEIVWGSTYGPGIDMTNQSSAISIPLSLPPKLASSCCSDTVSFCIRFKFTDTTCITCDTLVCYKIIRGNLAGTTGGNQGRIIPNSNNGELDKNTLFGFTTGTKKNNN